MIKRLIFSVFIFSLFGHLSAQINEDLSKLGSSVFDAFKLNNYAQLENQLANIDDMEDWMEQVMKYYPPEKQREIVAKKNENAQKGIKSMYDSFQSVYQTGISSGINWTKAKYVKTNAEYCGENPQPKEEVTCLVISFTYLGVEYHIQAAVVKVKRGYVLIDRFKFY
jgi:hypothetical protein